MDSKAATTIVAVLFFPTRLRLDNQKWARLYGTTNGNANTLIHAQRIFVYTIKNNGK